MGRPLSAPLAADGLAPPVEATDRALRVYSGYVMKRAFHAIQTDVTRVLEPHGLRMLTFSVLAVVVDNPGLRQAQLADALALERPNVVALIDDLERRGWVERARAPEDRRAYALRATEAGVRVHAAARASVDAHEADMTADLSAEERRVLFEALARIENRPRTRRES